MKLWQKDITVNEAIEKFTVGKDNVLDLALAPYDVLGSLAHTTMLAHIGLIPKDEFELLKKELLVIYKEIETKGITIDEGVEDIHSQVELILTQRLGDIGKKIHSGRSRNDQVLVDLKLFSRDAIESLVGEVKELFEALVEKSETYKHVLLPGYTHLQIAMPSSFGLWFGAYAESLIDDVRVLRSAYEIANQNPLGSGAGYGSSFPLDREMTTQLLGFSQMHRNVVYAQMSRGKTEYAVAGALSHVAQTISRFSMDVCLYMSQNFGFVTFPEELTTGSSIMPHKKNPDVFELARAKCNRAKAVQQQMMMIISNLPSGYHRDMQEIKELFMENLAAMKEVISIVTYMVKNIEVKEDIVFDPMYDYLFTVERVNELVLEGMPFRDAYKQVGKEIKEGTFSPSYDIKHTHAGSIGNIGNQILRQQLDEVIQSFGFDAKNKAIASLLGSA